MSGLRWDRKNSRQINWGLQVGGYRPRLLFCGRGFGSLEVIIDMSNSGLTIMLLVIIILFAVPTCFAMGFHRAITNSREVLCGDIQACGKHTVNHAYWRNGRRLAVCETPGGLVVRESSGQ